MLLWKRRRHLAWISSLGGTDELTWSLIAATILKGVGSVGLSLIFWSIGFLIAVAQLGVFLELVSYFPSRSGAEVVYLEQAYPRPKYLLPTAFAVQSSRFSCPSAAAMP